ncbi:MAG: TldD/PmbA family protein [Deltaproteobacteria bacterium]|nr:TldD/PmbA family protein [Deltaproteobacteria bacterium]
MDLEGIKKLVEKEFDAYEIFYIKETTKKIESRECEISGFEIKEEEGIALRAIKGNKMAFSYTFSLDKSGIEQLIKDIKEILPYKDEDDSYGFPDKRGDEEYPDLNVYDGEGQEVSMGEKVSMLIEMERTLRKDGRIVATRHCELNEAVFSVQIINSNGLSLSGKKTLYTLSGLAVAKDIEEVSWYDYIWSHRFKDIRFLEFAEKVREKAISFLSAKKIETGIYNGILSNRVVCDLLNVLSASFLAENLYKEKTKLKGKINTRCFSECINIKHSGNLGPLAFPFDGEGFPSRENDVVKSGYFKTFLYDYYYARKFGTSSTGNCVRSGIMDMPKCGVRGIYIEEGEEPLPELEEGEIVLEDLIGTHTANSVTGEFSLGTSGFIKKKGQLIPFHGVMISGNVFEIFEKVKGVGRDLRFYGNYASPSLFVEGLRISGV